MPVSRGRHTRRADVDRGAKRSGLKDLSFRRADGAHQEVVQGRKGGTHKHSQGCGVKVIVWNVLEEKCSEETKWKLEQVSAAQVY